MDAQGEGAARAACESGGSSSSSSSNNNSNSRAPTAADTDAAARIKAAMLGKETPDGHRAQQRASASGNGIEAAGRAAVSLAPSEPRRPSTRRHSEPSRIGVDLEAE